MESYDQLIFQILDWFNKNIWHFWISDSTNTSTATTWLRICYHVNHNIWFITGGLVYLTYSKMYFLVFQMYPLRGLSRWYRPVGWFSIFSRFKLDNIHRSSLEILNNYASLTKYYSYLKYLYIDLFHTIFTSSNSNWPFPESWILVPRILHSLLSISYIIFAYV